MSATDAMARTFTITCAAAIIRLEGNARGECAFTVTNTSSSIMRAQPSPVALDGHAEHWLGVMGQPVRELAPGQTIQITVTILPAAAPPGRYGFRLDVYAADSGERSTGPEAYIELISAAPPRPGPPSRFPWWLVILAVLLVAVGVVVGVAVGRSGKTVVNTPQPALEEKPDAVADLTQRWITAFRGNDAKALSALTPAPTVIVGKHASDDHAVLTLYTELLRSSNIHPNRLGASIPKPPTFTRVGDLQTTTPADMRTLRTLRLQADDHAVGVTIIADGGPTFVLLIRHGPPPRIAGVAR